ncbi:MAG TPA: purine-nucleoside phosphorylase [Gemmataceae bacterium]|nr:purine-nucleoside phosphorylase [Gemmataceae bacterium]
MSTSFADFVAAARSTPLTAAIILGSGANVVADHVSAARRISFADVPGLCATGVDGHRGQVTLADWAGQRVLIFEGRLHYYEGHPWSSVIRPIHIAHELGGHTLLVTNAAGGIHRDLGPGSLLAITDHILWNVRQPWLQSGPGGLGPSRLSPYCPRLLQLLLSTAQAMNIPLMAGCYASVTGPCYETPAEIRALRTWGADAVGMSTAREVQAAAGLGMACVAISCITNQAAGLTEDRLAHQDVLAVAASLTERLAMLIEGWLSRLRPQS